MKKSVGRPARFFIEGVRRGRGLSLLFGGVASVSAFSPEAVELSLLKGSVSVRGKGLTVRAFENGAAEICGKIGEVCFSDDKT